MGLEALHLAIELAGETGANIGFQDERDARTVGADGLGRAPHDIHDLIPFALDRREHRVGAVRKPGGAHDLDGGGDGLGHGSGFISGAGGGNRESNKHAPTVGTIVFMRPATSAAIHARTWIDSEPVDTDLEPATIRHALEDPSTLCWIDLVAPSPDQLGHLADELGLDPTTVEDALAPHERPKLTEIDGRLFFVVYATDMESRAEDREAGRLQTSRVSGFLLDHGLVTVRLDEDIDIPRIMANADRELAARSSDDVGVLVHVLFDYIVDGHFETIQLIDGDLEDLEDELFAEGGPGPEFSAKAYAVRKDLAKLRRYVLPMREVVLGLIRHEFADRPDPWFQDLMDHVLRASEWTDSLRDVIQNLVETHLQLQDSRLNTVMKKLAAWAAIIAVPTLVTGWFGQNVPFPGEGNATGFIASIVLVVGLSASVYVVMKRKDWL